MYKLKGKAYISNFGLGQGYRVFSTEIFDTVFNLGLKCIKDIHKWHILVMKISVGF